ncbi:cupin-like domain-containing protein [Cardinium endosymbiont of Nabis limbatus]|uniref:cupin-like domain-containing protein n=1 Tax=Cardinium endosymbiont of Nabis limbatus TaxID=3066217 RepID=UPI003AF4028C
MNCLFVIQPILAAPVIKEINQASLPKSEVEFEVQYYNCLNPVVFKRATKSWGTVKWDFRFFKSKYGDVPVSVQLSEILTGELQGPVKTVYINSTLKNYIDDVEKNGLKAGYLSQFDILNIHLELNDSLELPKFFKSKFLSITNLWIGPKGTNSKLHYDSDHNLFMQIHGKKLVLTSF